MKKIIFFILLLSGTAQAQTVDYYEDSLVWRIDTAIVTEDDTITSDSSYVQHKYSFIAADSIYEDQFVIVDSTGKEIVNVKILKDNGCSSSGTVFRKKLTPTQMGWTPKEQRDSIWLPIFKLIDSNIIEL
ncbi:MAG: hypothetical protein ACUZ8E_12490 [Candidatus Anammoxibacter sp.]